jgi:hypothetical protein
MKNGNEGFPAPLAGALTMLATCFALGIAAPAPLDSQEVELDLSGLADGPYSEMDMLLRKGVLFIKVDVARVSVRFGPETATMLQRLVTGSRLTSGVADSIAWLAIHADEALVTMEFVRNVSLDRFLSGIRDGAEKVWQRGFIERATYEDISLSLPMWYGALEERGVREGDRASYRISGDQLHTVFQGVEGTIFVDQVDVGRESVLSVLAGYFVEGSDFRDGLARSLYESER